MIALWGILLFKVGVGIDFAARDWIKRVRQFPDLLITGDVSRDYRNWSILPIAVNHLLTITTRKSMVLALTMVLVVGTTVILASVTYFRGLEKAIRITATTFATSVPAMALFFGGNGDQLLVVLLLSVALVRNKWLLLSTGILLGFTHTEIAAVALAGLIALAWADRDSQHAANRAYALMAVILARITIGIWFATQGEVATRYKFVTEYGISSLFELFARSWIPISITIATGGWLLLVDVLISPKRGRHTIVIGVYIFIVLTMTAITVDQSRVGMLCMFGPLIHLSNSDYTPIGNQKRRDVLLGLGSIIGLSTPLVIVWVGHVDWIVGTPGKTPW